MTSFRRWAATVLCRPLPPLIAQRVRSSVYRLEDAIAEAQTVTVAARTGSTFHTTTNDFHGYVFSVHGFYEWRNWALALALCAPDDAIIEIGANVGTETVGFSDLVPRGRVTAFEPLPSNLTKLAHALSELRHRNVEIRREALGSVVGSVRFSVPGTETMSGIGHVITGAADGAETTLDVPATTLDVLADEIGQARLICIDAEGAELSIIEGARRYLAEHQPALILEASPPLLERANRSIADLHGELRRAGYSVFEIGRYDLHPLLDEPGGRKPRNWLCVAAADRARVPRLRRALWMCGVLPCLPVLHPFTRPR